MPREKISKFDYVRFCLGGVIAGGAPVAIVASMLGYDPTVPREIGGLIGFLTVAIGFKLARWV